MSRRALISVGCLILFVLALAVPRILSGPSTCATEAPYRPSSAPPSDVGAAAAGDLLRRDFRAVCSLLTPEARRHLSTGQLGVGWDVLVRRFGQAQSIGRTTMPAHKSPVEVDTPVQFAKGTVIVRVLVGHDGIAALTMASSAVG